jgi:hypothetical protein
MNCTQGALPECQLRRETGSGSNPDEKLELAESKTDISILSSAPFMAAREHSTQLPGFA